MFFKKSLMDATNIPCSVTDTTPRVLQNNLKCDISPTCNYEYKKSVAM